MFVTEDLIPTFSKGEGHPGTVVRQIIKDMRHPPLLFWRRGGGEVLLSSEQKDERSVARNDASSAIARANYNLKFQMHFRPIL